MLTKFKNSLLELPLICYFIIFVGLFLLAVASFKNTTDKESITCKTEKYKINNELVDLKVCTKNNLIYSVGDLNK